MVKNYEQARAFSAKTGELFILYFSDGNGYTIESNGKTYSIGVIDCIETNRTSDIAIIYRQTMGYVDVIDYYYGATEFETDLDDSLRLCIKLIEQKELSI